jgi:hypothetical protein
VVLAAVVTGDRIGFAQAVSADVAPGQIWSITSETPTTAKVIIGRVEPWGGGTAVHVSIIDIPIPEGRPGAGGTTSFAHIPFDRPTLVASLQKLVGTDAPPPPQFETGYQQWRDDGGGVFTISVSDVIALIFAGLR